MLLYSVLHLSRCMLLPLPQILTSQCPGISASVLVYLLCKVTIGITIEKVKIGFRV